MIPERLKKLIILLKEKTIAKQAIWNKTSVDDQFKLSLPTSAITVAKLWRNEYSGTIWITIFNANGDAIERYDSEEDNDLNSDEIELLNSFHKAINDSYYKVEETMEDLFNQISKSGIVGSEQHSSPPLGQEDDDLPF